MKTPKREIEAMRKSMESLSGEICEKPFYDARSNVDPAQLTIARIVKDLSEPVQIKSTIKVSKETLLLVMDFLYELRGEWQWKRDEPRAGNQRQFNELEQTIKGLESLIGELDGKKGKTLVEVFAAEEK